MENQAAVRGKRQKAARHHKTIKDMETTTGSFLSAISTDIESDPAAVRELCQHNFQLDSHLEALEISLEKYTDLINGYEIKGSDDQEFKENQTEWIEQMDEFIRVTNINLVSLKFLQMECQKKDPQPAATAMAAGTTATIMDDDKLDRLLSEMVSMNQSNQSIMTNLTNSQSNASNKTGNTVKLPKLELFTFDGDVMKFKEFQDMFTATVHTNKSLSDVEKLSYLKTHVKGKALECISGLALSNSNYKVAWDLLMDRFGKDHVVINARILFDTGATRSFITESLCHKLHCNKIGEDTISVSSFGNEERKIETMPRVNLRIEQPDKSCTEVCANVTSILCHPIQRFPLPNDMKLHGMPLAEPPVQEPEKCDVDILIGVDHYHRFIMDGSIALQNGMCMVKSTFGYLPSGSTEYHGITDDAVHVLTTLPTTSHDPMEDTPVTAILVQGEGPDGSPAGMDPEQFTSFGKLVRVTAYVQKFIDKIQKKSVGNTISRDEYQRAESKWIEFTQPQHCLSCKQHDGGPFQLPKPPPAFAQGKNNGVATV